MAEYSNWDCNICGGFTSHREWCTHSPKYGEYLMRIELNKQGFKWDEKIGAYKCLRGCGTLVWDIDMHKTNVCTSYNSDVVS